MPWTTVNGSNHGPQWMVPISNPSTKFSDWTKQVSNGRDPECWSSSIVYQLVVWHTTEPLSRAAAAGTASEVLTEPTSLSCDAWTSAVVLLQLAEASTLETGAHLVGLDAATGDELSAAFDADDLRQQLVNYFHDNELWLQHTLIFTTAYYKPVISFMNVCQIMKQ